eukprot:750912-Hanusia_phi.AAC.2
MNITNSTGQVEEEFFSAYLEFLVRFKAKRGDTIEAISAVQKALLLSEKPGGEARSRLLCKGDGPVRRTPAPLLGLATPERQEPCGSSQCDHEGDADRASEREDQLFGDQPELVNMTFARAYEYAMAKGCVIWSKRIDAERTAHLIRFASGEEKEEMQKHLEELAASFAHDFDVVFSCSKGFMQIKEYTLAERWLEHA